MALITSVIQVCIQISPQKLGFHEKTTVLTYPHKKEYNEDKSGEHAGLALGPPLPNNLGKFYSKTVQHYIKLERQTIMLKTEARIDHNWSFYMCTVKITQ
jgi:hypothetical protein